MERKNKPNNGLSDEAVNAVMLGLDAESEVDSIIKETSALKAGAERRVEPYSETDFSKLLPEHVFSVNAYYKLFNKSTKREFLINGLVLESRVGLDSALRDKLLSRSVSAFRLENALVKFYCYKM